MPPIDSPGFYGKLPSRGDFVSRRLPAEFTSRWDAWLQEGLSRCQAELGAQWLDVYLTSPIWRFALQGGVCGVDAYLGVLVPSVDRVGRYFPLTVAVACPAASLPELAASAEPWFVNVEELMLETLADAPLDLEDFDRRLAELELDHAALGGVTAIAADGKQPDAARCWQLEVPEGMPIDRPMSAMASVLAGRELRGHAFWWTQGSERIAPCLAASSSLPAAQPFIALLDGRWEPRGWCSLQAAPPAAPAVTTGGLVYASAAVTDAGSRPINEDSFARDDERGVWIVADGLGGHRAGDVASRMVTSIVRAERAAARLDRRVEDLEHAIQVVNRCLQELVPRRDGTDLVGSTVAALILGERRAAWLWAGDSRVYRYRQGALARLSRDHVDADDGRAVTRAVGAPGRLEIDIERGAAQAGDRYLLCSDGLWSEVYAEQIALALSLSTPEAACSALRDTVATGEMPDNFTAVAVFVSTLDGHDG